MVDTIEGRGPAPAFVLSWIDGLPEDSVTVAMMRDPDNWREHFGKTSEWYLLADIYDATNQITRVSGNWKRGKAPTFDPYPRPGKKGKGKKKDKKVRTLADLYGSMGGAAAPQDGGALWPTL